VALVRALGPASVPRLDQIRIDGSVLAFALATSVGTALLFGTAPGLRLSRTDLQLLVTTGGRGTAGSPARARLGRTLVAAEVSLALVVLVGAGLLLRTFAKLRDVDTGFDARGVLTVQLSLPGARYPSARERTAFFHDVLARAAALPGVEAAGAGHPLPLSGNAWDGAFLVEGQPLRRGQPYPHAEYGFVTPGYFRALGVPLRAGRTFAESDDERAPEVAVIDEELARRYWPGQAAAAVVGRRLSLAGRPDSAWATVVGVVAHVRRDGARAEGEPQIYVPFAQRPQPTMAVVLRTAGDPAGLAAGLRRAVHAVDPDQPLTGLRTMTELTEDALARDRFNVLALGAFAALATLLAAVGLFGVLAYVVAQRSREIGVRMALGARPSDVVRLVIAQGLRPAAAGIAVGLLTAALASRLLRGLLFGVPPLDPSTYAMTSVLLAVVAVAACLAPAWRAARTDPTRAMRAD